MLCQQANHSASRHSRLLSRLLSRLAISTTGKLQLDCCCCCPVGGAGDQDAESGARLTCHLLLRLFRTVDPCPAPSLSRPLFLIRSPCDRHLLSAAHSSMRVEPVLAVLKAILLLGQFDPFLTSPFVTNSACLLTHVKHVEKKLLYENVWSGADSHQFATALNAECHGEWYCDSL